MIILDKELAFLQLAFEHLKFSPSEQKTMHTLVERGCILSPQLWEMIVEKLGGLKFINEHGYDFNDFTEAKTGSCNWKFDSARGTDSITGQITNVGGKIGHLRAAVYNVYTKKIDFFLLPPNHYCSTYSSNSNKQESLKFSYSRYRDTYSNMLEHYRVKDIHEVCGKIVSKKAA